MRDLESAMAKDIEAVYDHPDPEQYLETVEDEDLWAEAIAAIAVLALLYKKQAMAGVGTLANIYKVYPQKVLKDAAESDILREMRKYERDLRNKLPTRHQIKTLNAKLAKLGKSVVERSKLMVATVAGLTRKQANQVGKAVTKLVEEGKKQAEIVREATRRKKNQLNKRIVITTKMVTKEAAKGAGVKALQKMGKLPEGELWAEWIGVNDNVQSETCASNSGKHRKYGEAFPDGSIHPPSNTPHPCRSQLRMYVKTPDGEVDVKGANNMKTNFT
ncbi:hypothetical protein AT251_15695 [Enterovibrio nigricans]|nr:hypothetical protein AT251_15695 [Enterovibrio nigricans]